MSQPRVFSTPAGIRLGALDQIAPGEARSFVLQIGEAHFHGFVVRQDDRIYGYADRCPHNGMPLTAQLASEDIDQYLTPQGDLIACSWHGALFRISSGLCVAGPCGGQSLTPWPVTVADGEIVTA